MAWCCWLGVVGAKRGGGWCLIMGVVVGGTTSPASLLVWSLPIDGSDSDLAQQPRPPTTIATSAAASTTLDFMAKDDYATAGGPLRLKGSGGVVKHKSRKPKTKSSKLPKSEDAADGLQQDPKEALENDSQLQGKPGTSTSTTRQEKTYQRKHKTEAERKFEEARKKKLDQLLLKDAAKSHKERVEEFNKYLANLSEHHDMPRIGPG
ncbi:hypothetical protein TWF481_003498 [Arthrobotrys musiformis]|uniref:DUF1754-domain-containing protein n=1 Tax=Arthrobotrys musiformis TaxID=47236 RepID=A0AAV9VRP2_9PEZI